MFIVQIKVSSSDWSDYMQTHDKDKALDLRDELEEQSYNVRAVETL